MINAVLYSLLDLFNIVLFNNNVLLGLIVLMPWVVFFELPWTILVVIGMIKYKFSRIAEPERIPYYPSVSCIVTCYNEGIHIEKTVISLVEQIYPGILQILLVIDGADINQHTLEVAKKMEKKFEGYTNRIIIRVLPKWQRGGMVSSSNLALKFAVGDIIIKIDGDSSFDNNMVERATRHFVDPTVAAVSGTLRVENASESLCTRLQAIQYFLAIHASKTALSTFNTVNNISGAFGIFRRETLQLVQGWDAGTAEDLDITMRIKNYFANKKQKIRIVFDPEAICFTEVPNTFLKFYKQRIRWEGDFPYILYKHRFSLTPSLLGWSNFLLMIMIAFSNIVVPFLVFVYTVWLFLYYKMDFAIALLTFVYLFYLLLLTGFYLFSVIMVSERKQEDLSRVVFLPLMPIFQLLEKFNTLIAVLWEFFGKGHKDSSMAPWWILRKTKF